MIIKKTSRKNILKIEFIKNSDGAFYKYVNGHLKSKRVQISNLDLYVSNILLFAPNTAGKRSVKVFVDGKDKTAEILARLKKEWTKNGITLSFRYFVYNY